MARPSKIVEEKIRVHNRGKRSYDFPRKGDKPGVLLPGRAVTMDADIAKKYLEAYPNDLIEFDSLISDDKKNLSKENSVFKDLNAALLKEKSQLEADKKALQDEIQELKNKIAELSSVKHEK